MHKQTIKHVQQKLIEECSELSEHMKILDALGNYGRKYFCQYKDEEKSQEYHKGIAMMRKAIYAKHCEMVTNLHMFSGLPSEETQKYSLARLADRFGVSDNNCRYEVMDLMSSFGHHMSKYYSSDENEFRDEVKEVLEENGYESN